MTKRWMRWLGALSAVGLIAGCGGGAGGDSGGDPGTPTVASIELLASSPEVGTGGDVITLTAIVKGAGNVSLPNTTVTFSTDTGTLSGIVPLTDATGVATARFGAGNDRSNRAARITARAGTRSTTVDVAITGTRLVLSGPTALQLSNTAQLSLQLVDSRGNAVSGVAVTTSSSLGNGISPAQPTTNSQGNAAVTYSADASGTDTVTFSAAGASSSSVLTVSGEDFAFIDPVSGTPLTASQEVNVGAGGKQFSVRYRVGGAPVSGTTVNFTATAGTVTPNSAVTDVNGRAQVTVAANTASPATLQASIGGSTPANTTLPIEFIATAPNRLVLQVSPTAVPPNAAGSTVNQARVIARVTDTNGNPVKNQTINFSRDSDPSGGNLSQASAVTDSSGQASVQYISGQLSTATNGVVLRGRVASNSTVTGTATLTVSQSALFIALGTGNQITNLDPQTYQKDWTVYVTDANGVAVPGVELTIKALPLQYLRGNLVKLYNLSGDFVSWGQGTEGVHYSVCQNEDRFYGDTDIRSFNGVLDGNEDLNRNGILDNGEDSNSNNVLDFGEDLNNNGILEPGNVISVSPGTLRTDSTGRATLSLIYAESYVPWINLRLEVQAVVSGTASTARSEFFVTGLASDFNQENVPPAGVDSPFGTSLSCGP